MTTRSSAASNALILVDSCANGQRILELIGDLDKPAPKSPQREVGVPHLTIGWSEP